MGRSKERCYWHIFKKKGAKSSTYEDIRREGRDCANCEGSEAEMKECDHSVPSRDS